MKVIQSKAASQRGFTIVELLIVIVVIGVLAAITIVAYNGIQDRARTSRRDSDLANYEKAITLARISTNKVLKDITGSVWSQGGCDVASGNPGNIEPRNLAKTHICWTSYLDNLTKISVASGVNLDGLRNGDAKGNPYTLDENEGEYCGRDQMYYFTGVNASYVLAKSVPLYTNC